MMFPKDRTIYANLNTSFTSFEALLADLKTRRLTGYVELTFAGYTGTLLVSEGEIVNACEETAAQRLTGGPAVRAICSRAAEKDGTVNVFSAFPDVVLLLHRLMDSRPLYKDLTSAFTSLDRLIAKLRTDGLTGYVEVQVTDGMGTGVIYLSGGEPVESVLSTHTEFVIGQEALNTIVQMVGATGGSFNVFVEAESAPGASASRPAASGSAQESHREALLPSGTRCSPASKRSPTASPVPAASRLPSKRSLSPGLSPIRSWIRSPRSSRTPQGTSSSMVLFPMISARHSATVSATRSPSWPSSSSAPTSNNGSAPGSRASAKSTPPSLTGLASAMTSSNSWPE